MIFLQILIIFPVYQKSIFHRTLSLVAINIISFYLIMIYIYVFTFLETLTEAPSNRITQTEASIDTYEYNFPENIFSRTLLKKCPEKLQHRRLFPEKRSAFYLLHLLHFYRRNIKSFLKYVRNTKTHEVVTISLKSRNDQEQNHWP